MAHDSRGAESAPATGGAEDRPDINWLAAEHSSEFQELVHKRRSFVIPALAFVFFWYFGFIALAGYAPDFMGESVYEGVTIGYVLALSQFVMTWFLAWLYLRRAERDFDPLAEAAAAKALEPREASEAGRPTGGRSTGGDGEVRS